MTLPICGSVWDVLNVTFQISEVLKDAGTAIFRMHLYGGRTIFSKIMMPEVKNIAKLWKQIKNIEIKNNGVIIDLMKG